MKFLGLLWNNLLRNRRRTFLTVSTIAISLFLVATLLTVLYELENPPETPDSVLRLVTRHRVSLANILPKSYRIKIAQIKGVDSVVGSMWFGGIYKDPKNFFPQFAVDTDQFFRIYADFRVPDDQKRAFEQDRTGALVGDNLARRFGWKVGDRINLQGALFDVDPELTVRAVYSGGGDDGGAFYWHWDYFNEGMKQVAFGPRADFTGFYAIRALRADLVPAIAQQVDELFRNSNPPTKTESEKAFLLGFVSMIGNVRLLVASICSVVIFTILLVAANTMAMAIRERVREIGIMKALGFRRAQVLLLLVGESLFLAAGGALLGSLAARALYSGARLGAVTGGMFQTLRVTPQTIGTCLAVGLLVGILSAGVPAWLAARRRVVDALREVD